MYLPSFVNSDLSQRLKINEHEESERNVEINHPISGSFLGIQGLCNNVSISVDFC